MSVALLAVLVLLAGAYLVDAARELHSVGAGTRVIGRSLVIAAVLATSAFFIPAWALLATPIVDSLMSTDQTALPLPATSGSLVLRGSALLTTDVREATFSLVGLDEALPVTLRRPHGHSRGRKVAASADSEARFVARFETSGRPATVSVQGGFALLTAPLRVEVFAVPVRRMFVMPFILAGFAAAAWAHVVLRLRRHGYWGAGLAVFGIVGTATATPQPSPGAIVGLACVSLIAGAALTPLSLRAIRKVLAKPAKRTARRARS